MFVLSGTIWLSVIALINIVILIFLNIYRPELFPKLFHQKIIFNVILLCFFSLAGISIVASALETIDIIQNDVIIRSGNPSINILMKIRAITF